MKSTKKKVLTPEDRAGIEACTLASIRASNAYISEATGLDDGKISYALRVAKVEKGWGDQPGRTLRSEWSNGRSQLFQTFLAARRKEIQREIVTEICNQRARPTPKISHKGKRRSS